MMLPPEKKEEKMPSRNFVAAGLLSTAAKATCRSSLSCGAAHLARLGNRYQFFHQFRI